jgi:hypothetical protein
VGNAPSLAPETRDTAEKAGTIWLETRRERSAQPGTWGGFRRRRTTRFSRWHDLACSLPFRSSNMARLGLGLGVWLMGSAFVLWACTSSDDPRPVENTGGQDEGGTAAVGEGGNSGQAGHAGNGVAGAEGGSGGAGGEACRHVALDCARGACPESPDDFDFADACGPYNGIDRYASDCGGIVIRVWGDKGNGFDYYSSDYSFDAEGKLVGYAFGNDVARECPNVSGTPCSAIGEPEKLCGGGGAGGEGGGAGGEGGASAG